MEKTEFENIIKNNIGKNINIVHNRYVKTKEGYPCIVKSYKYNESTKDYDLLIFITEGVKGLFTLVVKPRDVGLIEVFK